MPESQFYGIVFIDSAWVLWACIWLAMSLNVKRTLRQEPIGSRVLHLAPLGLAALLLFAPPPFLPVLNQPVLPRAAWMVFAGAGLVAAGLGLAFWARLTIGRNWSGTVTVKQAHVLVQSGPYGLVRHPIYTGLLTAFLGTAIAIDRGRGVLALGLATASFLRKMRMEEKFMVEIFGGAYADYRDRTASLVPFLW